MLDTRYDQKLTRRTQNLQCPCSHFHKTSFASAFFRKIRQMDFTSPSFLVFHRSAPQRRATARLLTLVSGIRLGEDSAGINKVSQDTERSPLVSSARVCVTKARSPLILVSPCIRRGEQSTVCGLLLSRAERGAVSEWRLLS